MNDLATKKCIPCEVGTPSLRDEERTKLLSQIPGWKIIGNGKKLARVFEFSDFKESLAFLNTVGNIAEEIGHHPDLHLERYKHVRVELYTHRENGLSENDFILAAKINALGN